ncbi:hypothetical protein [Neisseria sp.]|uniref:hypothetical protein n=1 Tax=Neisseria sp. TaxID=192066 RepID=UPI0035A16D6F
MKVVIDYKFYIWDTFLAFEDKGNEILISRPYCKTYNNGNETVFAGHLTESVSTPHRMAVLRRMMEKETTVLYSEKRDAVLTLDDIQYLPESENWGMVLEIVNGTDDCA